MKTAVIEGERKWSVGEIWERSLALAQALVDDGLGSGDRVAVMMTNRIEFVIAVHAVSVAGASSVLLSPAWKSAEVGHALELTQPARAIADGDAIGLLASRVGDEVVIDAEFLPQPGSTADRFHAVHRSTSDEALLVFSSGTTGMPKAVCHTHRSIRAATRHWVEALGLSDTDRFQIATPPSHILGLLNLLAAIEANAQVRLHRRFVLDEVLSRIVSDQITLEMAVAPIALAMANHENLESFDLSSLRYIMWGATPVTPSVADTVTRRTGVRFLAAYGASELPVLAVNPGDRPDEWRLDSAGLPPDEVELRAVSLEDGTVLPAGEVGEIEARGPSVMEGYLPLAANAKAFHDGWYRTGDVGWLEPEGWVHLTDRAKEMIKVNGFQVAPAEIEAVLHAHPAVVDCAVFGVPDDHTGEAVIAAVVLDPSHTLAVTDLQEAVVKMLASYKRPRRVVVVASIPRLPSGKVLRRQLRDELFR